MPKTTDSRVILTLLWLAFFCINLGLVIDLKAEHWLREGTNDFTVGLTSINNVYSPYLGVILVYYWNKRSDPADPFNMAFYLAFFLSIIWNGLVTVLLVQLRMGQGDFAQNLELIKNITGLFSWIVAGSVGFYFGKG